ncbi:unnamed protein product [Timema podura]|uniref:DUF4485 domain-containing protein n=1 Tax=Timema podura TaxID=61482 RepID=A0ABN7NW70_TIMPD|nr:unnamed protein product [Timema podura]
MDSMEPFRKTAISKLKYLVLIFLGTLGPRGKRGIESKTNDHLNQLWHSCKYSKYGANGRRQQLAWLQKLCGEAAIGEDCKRTRNAYLSHLVLEMQEGRLMPPFLEYPPEGKLRLAVDVFGPESAIVKEPPWLQAIAEGTGADFIHSSKDGRTYLASRYLNDGKGAFSYMAISVADQEPLFVPLSEG